MIVLNDTTESLVVTLGGANSHDFLVQSDLVPHGSKAAEGEPGETNTNVALTTANAPICAAPPSGAKRIVRRISVRNMTATSTTVAISKRVGTTNYALGPTVTLADGQSVVWGDDGKIQIYNKTGEAKAAA